MDLECATTIEALVSDVDGVLTDGSIIIGETGETKCFSVRDGLGISLWIKTGAKFALLSGRASAPVTRRAAELGIHAVKTGRLDKQTALVEIAREIGVPCNKMAYIGDDLPDLAPMQMAALSFAPGDAVDEVRAAADFIVPVDGGRGVVRHVVEHLLKAQGKWSQIVARFEVKP